MRAGQTVKRFLKIFTLLQLLKEHHLEDETLSDACAVLLKPKHLGGQTGWHGNHMGFGRKRLQSQYLLWLLGVREN